MFTGIIEAVATVSGVSPNGSGKTFRLSTPLSATLKIDQSVAHNGVCLTVEHADAEEFQVTAIEETLKKTNLGHWRVGSLVNLERCLTLDGRLDGHFVQGHVDGTGTCLRKDILHGSWEYTIAYPEAFAPLLVEKGSICLEGISLTAFDITRNSFKVAIIPYTYEHTNIRLLNAGDTVNLEFDLIGKYIHRKLSLETLSKTQTA